MTSSEKNSQRVLLIMTCCLVSQARLWADGQTSDPAQVSITRTPDAAPVLSDRARRQLQGKLESAATTPLQIVDVDGAPLEITGTKVRSIKIEGNYDGPSRGATINDYAMKLSFRLANRSGKLVTGLGLEFTNTQQNNVFFCLSLPSSNRAR